MTSENFRKTSESPWFSVTKPGFQSMACPTHLAGQVLGCSAYEQFFASRWDWSRAIVDGSSIRAVFGGFREDRIPPTGPNWAASAVQSARVAGFLRPSNSPRPIVTTRSRRSLQLTPSHGFRESEGAHAADPIACSATAVMTRRRSGKVCVTDASSLCVQSATPNTGADWGDGAGWWNEPSLG
jgi:hypothetical protein